MARVTVEDCLENVSNRFELVMVASKRARQIATGGKDPMVQEESDKPTVIALREIAEGFVTPEILSREEELEAQDELAGVMDSDEGLSLESLESPEPLESPESPEPLESPTPSAEPPLDDEPL